VAVENIEKVGELISSQEDQPGTSRSTRKIVASLFCPANCKTRSSSDCICRVQHRSSRTQSWALLKTSSTSAKDSYKEDDFHWWENFYLNAPANNQNNRVWAVGNKCEVDENRLLVQRANIASHVIMVSAGACFTGKGWFHFRTSWKQNFTLILCYQNWLRLQTAT